MPYACAAYCESDTIQLSGIRGKTEPAPYLQKSQGPLLQLGLASVACLLTQQMFESCAELAAEDASVPD